MGYMIEVRVTKRKQPVYLNWFSINIRHTFPCPIIGKWEYIAESSKGKISIVKFPDYYKDGRPLWKIYCLEGQLFNKVERFGSYDEAEAAAIKYLE
jgi:hypothetical protein